MSIVNISNVVASQAAGSGTSTSGPAAAGKFAEALAQASRPAAQAAAGQQAQAAIQPPAQKVDVVARLAVDQKRMDEVLALAQSGKNFSPAELISLQTQVYRSSQQLDLAGKVVEKTTGGVKQVLQTQL